MKKKIKVFLLQEIIPNYRVPIFQRLSNLNNIDLTVFYSDPSKNKQKESLRNAEQLTGFKSTKLPSFAIGKKTYQFSLIKYLILKRPDVLISGKRGALDALLFLLYCKIFNIKLLWLSGGVPYTDKNKIKELTESGRLTRIFGKYHPKRWLSFKADGMIVYSEHAKQYYSSLGFPKARIFVEPNSPDTEKLLEYKKRIENNPDILSKLKKKYSPHGEKIIFMLGRLNKGRKTGILLDSFEIVQKKYPLTTLIIIGDGSERYSLQHTVENKNLNNVYFLGTIYDDEILARYFMLCDIYVTSGIASLTIKMAMTFDKPVVSVAYGLEVHSIQNGKNGYVVDINDSNALAEKILLLLKDDDLRREMGEKAKETILNRININKMIEGFERAIKKISKQK